MTTTDGITITKTAHGYAAHDRDGRFLGLGSTKARALAKARDNLSNSGR
jgi:hypothetical protein